MKDFKHSIWTPTWPFLQVIYSICCLVYSLITCIHGPWLFSSHISTLWEWCLPLSKPWRKRRVKVEMRVKSEHQRVERHGHPLASHVVSFLSRSLSFPLEAVDSLLCSLQHKYLSKSTGVFSFVCEHMHVGQALPYWICITGCTRDTELHRCSSKRQMGLMPLHF